MGREKFGAVVLEPQKEGLSEEDIESATKTVVIAEVGGSCPGDEEEVQAVTVSAFLQFTLFQFTYVVNHQWFVVPVMVIG